VNFLGDGTLTGSHGKGSGRAAGPDPPPHSPQSNMSSKSLLQLEQSGSLAGAATGAWLRSPLWIDSGNPPEVTLAVFPCSVADSVTSR